MSSVRIDPVRLNLPRIDHSLRAVELHWHDIDDELAQRGIGRKDTPVDATLRGRMLSASVELNRLVAEGIAPFSERSLADMLLLNHRVHYGTDVALMAEYARAIEATHEKFWRQIVPIAAWYRRHARRGDHPFKLAAEVYVAVLGRPQLFIEGNHRTGALVASWINLAHGHPPFVLSVDNAVAYFAPSAEIKSFADRSTWRGRARLPKYRASFERFWERHLDARYLAIR